MDNFSDKISGILSDPDSMEKIKSIAGALMGDGEKKLEEHRDLENFDGDYKEGQNAPNFADLLGGGLPPGIDPKLISKLIKAYSSAGKMDDSRLALLYALKPYLSKNRSEKIDTAVNMLRLSKAAKAFFEDNDAT